MKIIFLHQQQVWCVILHPCFVFFVNQKVIYLQPIFAMPLFIPGRPHAEKATLPPSPFVSEVEPDTPTSPKWTAGEADGEDRTGISSRWHRSWDAVARGGTIQAAAGTKKKKDFLGVVFRFGWFIFFYKAATHTTDPQTRWILSSFCRFLPRLSPESHLGWNLSCTVGSAVFSVFWANYYLVFIHLSIYIYVKRMNGWVNGWMGGWMNEDLRYEVI